MTVSELISLIRRLHEPDQQAERQNFYRALEPYRIESDYPWEDHMNDSAGDGIIWSGVYLAWALDQPDGIQFWDTTGSRYQIPYSFPLDG